MGGKKQLATLVQEELNSAYGCFEELLWNSVKIVGFKTSLFLQLHPSRVPSSISEEGEERKVWEQRRKGI